MTKKASSKELSVLCSQLHIMVSSGMTLSESLRVVSEITKAPRLKKALNDAYLQILNGEQLHSGFLKNKDVFPSFFIHMLHFGEETGSLEEALRKMDSYFEKDGRLRDKIRSSMTYPAAVFLISMVVMAALLTFIVPGFADTLEELGGELPAATRLLLAFSAWTRGNLLAIAAALLAGTALLGRFVKTPKGKECADRLKFRLPIIRIVFRHAVLSSFCRNMSIMVGSGFNIVKALDVCAQISENTLFSRKIMATASLIKRGGGVCSSFSAAGIDDRLFLSLVKTGEDTGAVDRMLERAAEHYEREVDNLIERSLRLLEPAVIVAMAVVIGAIIISVMLPVMSIMDSI